jgi:hypothetical protein
MNFEISQTLDGHIQTYDKPPSSAGKSGQKSGAEFEEEVFDFLIYNAINVPTHYRDNKRLVTRPVYTNYVGARGKRGDMTAIINGREYHIECKRLNGCESHIEKLAYIDLNLRYNCYNSQLVLVYSIGAVTNDKYNEVRNMMNSIRNAGGMVFEYNEFRSWIYESKNEKDTSRDYYNSLYRFTD